MRNWWKIIFVALLFALQPLWMNNKPILLIEDGTWSWPVFSGANISKDYYQASADFTLWPLIPYSPEYSDPAARGRKAPFTASDKGAVFSHWLGTDILGRDLLAGLISGLNFALLIGLFSMIPALIIGTLIGWLSAYYGNSLWRLALWQIISLLLLGFYFIFLLFYGHILLSICCLSAMVFIGSRQGKGTIEIPLDNLINKLIEIIQSIPGLMLVILLGALIGRNWFQLSMLIAAVAWTSFAKYIRADSLKLKSNDYVLSAKALGLNNWQIFLKHFLPNLLPGLKVLAAYGIAGAVFIESSLTFLGIGLPDDAITWGSILAEGKRSLSSWWLILFPSLCLFLFIYTLHSKARKSTKSESLKLVNLDAQK